MKILVLNAGSSSLKAEYFVDDRSTWSAVDRWTDPDLAAHGRSASALIEAAVRTHGIAPDVVGHRVVHGLSATRPEIVTPAVRALIEAAAELAPLHNRAALAGIDAARALFPGTPQVAVFDTAFHATLAPAARVYPLPYAWYAERHLMRYGFHGISHRANGRRSAELAGRDPARARIVSAHLGSGASLCAIRDGASIDTTMGLTTMEGIVMGTRSGSVDPGLVLYLLRGGEFDATELERILNEASGLLGLSGLTDDMRDILAAERAGHERATLALQVYVHRLVAGIGAMAAVLGGIDILSFTGGIGEHAASIRARTCDALAYLGIAIDPAANAAANGDAVIGDGTAGCAVCVVTAREERSIAREAESVVGAAPVSSPA